MALRDLDLLLLGVSGDADDLHSIAEWRADGLGDVRGGDEQHLREVVRNLEIMIAELPVLFRIEHLEQCRRRIAAEVRAHLVDLVEHDHRVARAGGAHRLDDPSRQRPDVCAPVTSDLRLIADAAQAHAHELAVECSCDGPSANDASCRRLGDLRSTGSASVAFASALGAVGSAAGPVVAGTPRRSPAGSGLRHRLLRSGNVLRGAGPGDRRFPPLRHPPPGRGASRFASDAESGAPSADGVGSAVAGSIFFSGRNFGSRDCWLFC